jgi:hypothetical protein
MRLGGLGYGGESDDEGTAFGTKVLLVAKALIGGSEADLVRFRRAAQTPFNLAFEARP